MNITTTKWTEVIDVIQKCGEEKASQALSEFCKIYQDPVRDYFLTRGCSPHDAKDYAQEFFLQNVVEQWNRRHGKIGSVFLPEEIKDLPKFAERLRASEKQSPPYEFFLNSMSDPTRKAILGFERKDSAIKKLRPLIVNDLNRLLDGPNLSQSPYFAEVENRSAETRNLLQQPMNGHWVAWLNHSLLVDVFHEELSRNIGFIYLVERKPKGRFRHFLFWMLRCFFYDQLRRGKSKLREGSPQIVSLDELEEWHLPADKSNIPGDSTEFDRAFAMWIIKTAVQMTALDSLNDEAKSSYIRRVLDGTMSTEAAAKETGRTEVACKAEFDRLRKRLAANVRTVVSNYSGPDKAIIQQELKDLQSLLKPEQ